MRYKNNHKDKHFPNSVRLSTCIDKADPILYIGDDGSAYEVEKYGLFQKYKQVVEADTEPEYETCKDCGQMHNELASRTYDDVPTSIDVIKELGKKSPLSVEVNQKS